MRMFLVVKTVKRLLTSIKSKVTRVLTTTLYIKRQLAACGQVFLV